MAADRKPEPATWDPIRALTDLQMERALHDHPTPQDYAKKLFEENLAVAVMSICHLATYSEVEAIRFQAAKYVVERTMGPAERVVSTSGRHAWDDIYDNVVNEAENFLKNASE